MRSSLVCSLALAALLAAGCDNDPTGPGRTDGPPVPELPVTLPVLGQGVITQRYSAELWVRDGVAYTTTWGNRGGNRGNTVYVWDVAGNQPVLLDSLHVERAGTLGDVQVSDDGRLLVVAVEHVPNGALALYDLADPRRPRLITRYTSPNVQAGVHTAEVARVNGRLYAFLSVDPVNGTDPVPARLVILDLSDPAAPQEVFAQAMGDPFIHDVFVRDGYLFTALWDEGLAIWDIGARGGSPESPVRISTVKTEGGNVHNVWWFHGPSGARRYAFVGEEQPGKGIGTAGDIHVVDVSDLSNPREVAFFHVPDVVDASGNPKVTYGTHNFWMDEERGILFAAYYNGGVRAVDVRGDLSACEDAQRDALGRCDLGRMGREVGLALTDLPVSVWGVQLVGSALYASDMHNGLWKLDASELLRALER